MNFSSAYFYFFIAKNYNKKYKLPSEYFVKTFNYIKRNKYIFILNFKHII